MAELASSVLRNDTRAVLARVERGEQLIITVAGRPVAEFRPIAHRSRWMPRDRFIRAVLPDQADATLAAELRVLARDTTDDLPRS